MKSVEILQFDIDKGLIVVEKILDIHGGRGKTVYKYQKWPYG